MLYAQVANPNGYVRQLRERSTLMQCKTLQAGEPEGMQQGM